MQESARMGGWWKVINGLAAPLMNAAEDRGSQDERGNGLLISNSYQNCFHSLHLAIQADNAPGCSTPSAALVCTSARLRNHRPGRGSATGLRPGCEVLAVDGGKLSMHAAEKDACTSACTAARVPVGAAIDWPRINHGHRRRPAPANEATWN